MPSSKLPVDFVPVPQQVIDFGRMQPTVFCNPRPEQRTNLVERLRSTSEDDLWRIQLEINLQGEGFYLDPTPRRFLRDLPLPANVVIHYQGYGEETGTSVVRLDKIYWTDEMDEESAYARLDFQHPPKMEEIHGCPNFWAAFILAIAPVKYPATFDGPDPDGREFIRIVSEDIKQS